MPATPKLFHLFRPVPESLLCLFLRGRFRALIQPMGCVP